MNYTLLTTERNGEKLEFEIFTYRKKRKNENTQITTWRCTDRCCKGIGKTIEGSFEFLLRIKNILEGYQNNRIELALDGLSDNYEFV